MIIPDAVFFEATRDATRLGASIIVEWVNANPAPPEPPQPSPVAKAERYALHHRKRAMLVRRLRHLPPKFGWPPHPR